VDSKFEEVEVVELWKVEPSWGGSLEVCLWRVYLGPGSFLLLLSGFWLPKINSPASSLPFLHCVLPHLRPKVMEPVNHKLKEWTKINPPPLKNFRYLSHWWKIWLTQSFLQLVAYRFKDSKYKKDVMLTFWLEDGDHLAKYMTASRTWEWLLADNQQEIGPQFNSNQNNWRMSVPHPVPSVEKSTWLTLWFLPYDTLSKEPSHVTWDFSLQDCELINRYFKPLSLW
jgi:hypothetical protein